MWTRMKTPVGLVTVALTVAILLALSFLIATGTRGQQLAFDSSAGELEVRTVARGLVNPWALAFLPDGTMLVTERPGRMRVVSVEGQLSPPLKGVPEVWASGQGGLLDVVIDKSFAQNRTIYFCYAERTEGGGRTAVARAKLNDGKSRLDEVKVIFRQQGPLSSGNHYGCRIAQADDGNLFVTLGEHFAYRDQAQGLDNHLGKVIRIAPDGSVPSGNPFAGRSGAKAEIWSYGHRNMQGAALHPDTGELWTHEHGPQGGDELNIDLAGHNYGWPVDTYGVEYGSGKPIGEGTTKAGMTPPVRYWVPSIAISGMAFLTSNRYPRWQGHQLFIGALRGQALVRLQLDGQRVVLEERLLTDLDERIRDVRQGPDGWLYLMTDSPRGRILRLSPR